VELAGAENLNKCYFTNHYSVEDPSEKIQNFIKAYEEKYNATPDAFAALVMIPLTCWLKLLSKPEQLTL